jgi:hypothetical protein
VSGQGIWELPGPTRFIEKVLSGFSRGNNVTVVIPEFLDASDFTREIHARLDAVRRTHVVRLGEFDAERSADALNAMERDLSIASHVGGAPLSVRHLLTDWLIASQDALVLDLTRIHRDDLDEWARALHRYADFMRPQVASRRVGLVILCRDRHLEVLPPTDVNVSYLWWWGVLDRLDMLFASRNERMVGPEGEVRMNMVVEIGAFDPGLVRHLLERWDGDHRRVIDPLAEYGRSAHDPDTVAEHSESFELQLQRVIPGDPVPASMRSAWNAGLLELWEGAACWHRSFLAALVPHRPDAIREIMRLAWRAQVATLLPSIEFSRHAIARSVAPFRTRLHPGSKLAGSCTSEADVEALEYSDLQEYLRSIGRDPRFSDMERIVSRLRRFRNRLAHVDPRDSDQVRELLGLINEAREAAR